MSVTNELASLIVADRFDTIPPKVVHEARRAILNFVGCAVGASRELAVDVALRAIFPFAGKPTASIIGRRERLDPLNAGLINGIASHVHDFDDTTPENFSHSTSPVASAVLAFGSANGARGADLLHAFILGFETATKIANAVTPAHYARGWHITSTVGVIGAAVAVARLLRLPSERMVWAIGLAVTQAAGVRDVFGSMGKSFNPGRAAQSGYLAALLAEQGFTGGNEPLEGPRGFAAVMSQAEDMSAVVRRFGAEFDLLRNAYKPFPCGLVIHPTIDACIQLHQENHGVFDDVASVRLRVPPIVIDLCNKRSISTGLEARFSVYHAAAVGLVRGRAGLEEFSDAAVGDPILRALRDRVVTEVDASLPDSAVRVELVTASGDVRRKCVDEPLGSLAKPLSDAELEAKAVEQSAPCLGKERARALAELCWRLDRIEDVGDLFEATTPD